MWTGLIDWMRATDGRARAGQPAGYEDGVSVVGSDEEAIPIIRESYERFRQEKTECPRKEQVLDALKKVKFPGLSRDIVSFSFVHDVRSNGGDVSFIIRFQTRKSERRASRSRATPKRPCARLEASQTCDIDLDVGAAGSPHRGGAVPSGSSDILSRREVQDRRRLGKGRRREVHGLHQPRSGSARPRLHRRPARRRHLRPLAADDARHRGPSADRRARREDHPDGEPRHQDDVARPDHRSRHAGDLARADGDEGARSVPQRREVGRRSTS